MRKTLISLLTFALIASPLMGLGNTAKAATTNTTVRGESALTVYWYAPDGKRYTFPNADTYYTWFPLFDTVTNISDADLQAIPLGNQNVTYRPGAKLVKVQTDPKVYAVSKNAVLRHVTSESLARDLYGADWRLQVKDIPDTFFTDYTVGTPIYSVSDYNVSNEYYGVTYLHDSLKTATSGSTNQTGSLTLSADRAYINSGEAVTLTANYNGTLPANGRIEIKNVASNETVKTCYNTSYCSITLYPIKEIGINSVQYITTAKNNAGSAIATQYSPVVYFNGSTSTNGTLTLSADHATVTQGQSVTLNANYWGTLPTGGYLRMVHQNYGSAPNAVTLNTCYSNSCSYTYTFSQKSSTKLEYNFRAYVMSANHEYVVWSLPDIIVHAYPDSSSNNGLNYVNGLTLQADQTSIASGDRVKLTANAFNAGNWNYIGNRIEIRDLRNGSIVQTCNDQSWCVANVTVNTLGSETQAQFEAHIYDRNGAFVLNQDGPVIYFTITGSTGTSSTGSTTDTLAGNVNIEFNPNSNLRTNGTIYISANVLDTNARTADLVTRVYDERSSSPIATCYGAITCTTSYFTGASPVNTRIHAIVTSASNPGSIETSRYQLTTTY